MPARPPESTAVYMGVVDSRACCCAAPGYDLGQGEEGNYFCSGERGYHTVWDSRLFNYRNWEVLRYLLSNLRWWLEEYRCPLYSPAQRLGSPEFFCCRTYSACASTQAVISLVFLVCL